MASSYWYPQVVALIAVMIFASEHIIAWHQGSIVLAGHAIGRLWRRDNGQVGESDLDPAIDHFDCWRDDGLFFCRLNGLMSPMMALPAA
jgi:hypothetical protein